MPDWFFARKLGERHEGEPMNHWHHMLICLGLVAVAVVLATVGAGAFAFVPALACGAMMGAMVWMMVRSSRSG
jgi:H+/Cl- antiporter ClcA